MGSVRPGALPLEAHLAALSALEGVGPARLRWLLGRGTPAEVWQRVRAGTLPTPPPQLGLDAEQLRRWRAAEARIDPASLWRSCLEHHVGVVSLGSPAYPSALCGDPDPPVVLFHRGDPEVISGPRVAVVGMRRATGYGLRVAHELGGALAAAGVSVVSGLALGIDAAAHRGALDGGGAPCIAVVAAGLHAPCPVRNRGLAAAVAERGVVLSEVPTGVRAAPWRFPVRNRILAALAEAVVVVESGVTGGSMHTVREALARQRPVLAVPGPVGSASSEGTNALLADGALVCRDAQDVLVAIGRGGALPPTAAPPPEPRPAPTGDAATVLDALEWRPASVDRLAAVTGLGVDRLARAVRHLEERGWVQRRDGWIERIARAGSVHPGTRGRA
jgi:DNA processing protein